MALDNEHKTLIIRDMDLASNFEELYTKSVFLYGAGNNGKIALQLLGEFGIKPDTFYDSNTSLKGKMVEGVTIKTLDELMNAETDSAVIIITTTSIFYEEIAHMLHNKGIVCKRMYTFAGFLYAAYYNMDVYGKSDKLSILKTIWLHNQKLDLDDMQAKVGLYKMLLGSAKDVPIVVYQPGKVGSNTVEYSLQQRGVRTFRSHGISYPALKSGIPDMEKCLVNCIKSLDKVKMITLVREPISKDIGHFFQKIDLELPDAGWFVKGLIEKNFQQSFLNYLSIVTPFDFTEDGKKERFHQRIICHIDAVGMNNPNGALWGWFDEELKKNFNIDVLSEDFDVEKGYSIINHENIELLIMKLEKLDYLSDVIGKFVGINDFKIVSTNKGETKSYKYVYKQFLEEVTLPQKYVDFYYKDNKYINHFYSEDERNRFYMKWQSHIR